MRTETQSYFSYFKFPSIFRKGSLTIQQSQQPRFKKYHNPQTESYKLKDLPARGFSKWKKVRN